MTAYHLQVRTNIRRFLEDATIDELYQEHELSVDMGDLFRAACVREMIQARSH